MAFARQHRIIIAADGSPSAQAAIDVTTRMPWHTSSRALGVVGRPDWVVFAPAGVAQIVSRATAETTANLLSAYWPGAQVVEVDKDPVHAILGQAKRFEASVIVLGWRGHGTFERLIAGSVSRAVAAAAPCPVLVARTAPASIRRFLIGYDATPNAERAIEFMCSLNPTSDTEAIVVDVVEPLTIPASSSLLPPAIRARLQAAEADLKEETERVTRPIVDRAVEKLARCGWRARGEVRQGTPLATLLDAARTHNADILVLGARAVTGVERLLLGSVANGALNRAQIPVLLTR